MCSDCQGLHLGRKKLRRTCDFDITDITKISNLTMRRVIKVGKIL